MRVVCERDAELKQCHRVGLEGNLDALGAAALWDGVSDRVGPEMPALLIDMSGVRYMSSGGIGVLVRLLARVQQIGGGLSVYACSPRVRCVMGIVGLEGILNVRETEADARARLTELGIT